VLRILAASLRYRFRDEKSISLESLHSARLDKVWKSHSISNPVKFKMFRSCVRSNAFDNALSTFKHIRSELLRYA
jgi:hypothetical protein